MDVDQASAGEAGNSNELTSPPSSRSLSVASSPRSSHAPSSPVDVSVPLPSPPSSAQLVPPAASPAAPATPAAASPAGPDVPLPPTDHDPDAPATAAPVPADAAPDDAPSSSKAKPVKRRRRSPSLSPSPPPPPPPLTTVRLDIALGGPDNYEVNVRQMAKDVGQRPDTPPNSVRQYISESDSSDDEAAPAGTKPKRKKKTLASEYYDVTDPFIDDSELALDQRTYFAQTKQQGFYVSSGEVALLKDRSAPPKSKAKRVHLPAPEPIAGPSNFPGAHQQHTMLGRPKPTTTPVSHASPPVHAPTSGAENGTGTGTGTRDAPIAIASDGEDPPASSSAAVAKRKAQSTDGGSAGVKKRRKVDMDAFHPELRDALHELRLAKEKENWDVKGKFPPGIKPLLTEVAVKAIKLNQYDDNFFNYMPELFPYNRFTMSKLIKRLVYADHMTLLVKRQDEILAELKQLVDEAWPKIREDHDKAYRAWLQKMEKLGLSTDPATLAAHSSESTPHPVADKDGVDAGADMDIQMYRPKEDHVPSAPQQRFKLSERMKGLIWNLVCLSNECCRIENEKSTLEGNTAQVSEQGLRKVLYQKIVGVFPDGWMNSGQISRDVSVIKKKLEKEIADMEQ
ncbi:hypothetical protein K488DRAFT_85781 [Vararia minispora EC-137]|uniref:Uncharacterized protein n=1 Tax=Vararia minispora EC-137 TaxID=1314806 RepID=A0ACB8QLG5_9AGAM|nr:hypothetical protein K488DRAFT_85781 [Vararia minispora EC-137]